MGFCADDQQQFRLFAQFQPVRCIHWWAIFHRLDEDSRGFAVERERPSIDAGGPRRDKGLQAVA